MLLSALMLIVDMKALKCVELCASQMSYSFSNNRLHNYTRILAAAVREMARAACWPPPRICDA